MGEQARTRVTGQQSSDRTRFLFSKVILASGEEVEGVVAVEGAGVHDGGLAGVGSGSTEKWKVGDRHWFWNRGSHRAVDVWGDYVLETLLEASRGTCSLQWEQSVSDAGRSWADRD